MFRQQSGEDGAVTLRPPRADDTAVLITARDDAFRRWLGADHVRVRLFGGHLAEESAAHERVERMFAELLEEMTDGSAVAGS